MHRWIFTCCYVSFLFLLSSVAFGAEPGPLGNREVLNTNPGQSQATDNVYLKNGSILHGVVVRFENGFFTVVIPGTQSRAMVHVNDVERIEFAESALTSTGQAALVTPPRQREESKPPPSSLSKQESTPRQQTQTTLTQPEATEKTQTTPVANRSQLVETKPSPATQTPPTTFGPPAEKKGRALTPASRDVTVTVPGREVWSDSGLDVSRGDRLRFSASGKVNLSRTQVTGPEGVNISDPQKMMPTRPTGGLIGVIGDDNDDFIFIGATAEVVAQHSGRLFLMVNENNLDDNSGAFTVRIQVQSPSGQNP